MTEGLPLVMTVEQAAKVLAISRGTAYAGCRSGEIPSVRIGNCVRVPRQALEAMLTRNGNAPDENGDQHEPLT